MAKTARSSPRATIDDVAALAGVSIATVSRVVNGTNTVSAALDERVRSAIASLGYEPSLVARSLRSQQTNVIGVLVSDIEPFSAEVLKGVANALRATEYELIVYAGRSNGAPGWERRFVSRLSGTLTDGTIIVTPTVADLESDYPLVAVDPHTGHSTIPTVSSQNFEGAHAVTAHLIELGHRRIGLLTGRPDLESARLREAGYRAALAEAGVAVDPALIVEGGFKPTTAHEPAHRLLEMDDRPTAIFAANDLMAIEAMAVATSLGLSVPGDVSIAGFDNVPESALTDPPLTTLDQSVQQLGFVAVHTLLGLIEHPERRNDPPTNVLLSTTLVVRDTTGPPGRR